MTQDQINLELACGRTDSRPTRIVTDTVEAFQAVCDREDRGELTIEAVSRGEGNGQWVFDVWYLV